MNVIKVFPSMKYLLILTFGYSFGVISGYLNFYVAILGLILILFSFLLGSSFSSMENYLKIKSAILKPESKKHYSFEPCLECGSKTRHKLTCSYSKRNKPNV